MSSGQRLARRIASKIGWPSTEPVCPACRETLSHRPYSTAAAATAPETSEHVFASTTPTSPATTSAPQDSYSIRAGVVLSRAPQLTRDLTPFEKSFFLYQRRLNERLALPFTRYFYIQKGTPADLEWKRKIKQRLTPARDIGVYSGYGKESWNDEVRVGAQESEPSWQVEQLLEDAKPPEENEEGGKKVNHELVERPPARETKADQAGDEKRLDRKMQETLYLMVKNKEGRWVFPEAQLEKKEVLHAAAERVLVQSCGINMNTWVVGNVPIGQYQFDSLPNHIKVKGSLRKLGEKTFFMKARILAGQADLKGNQLGLQDFKWLSKDEIKKYVSQRYWSAIQNMFAER